MNDRLWELYDEAVESVPDDAETLEESMQIFTQKIAELIVKECAEVVKNQYSEDWGKWSNTMILEHFGMKE